MSRVEILYFEDCPNYRAAIDLVRRVADESELSLTQVGPDEVEATRFLGSPTIRVDGRDVEPGADARTEYVYACRVYRTEEGMRGIPDPRWVAAALGAE